MGTSEEALVEWITQHFHVREEVARHCQSPWKILVDVVSLFVLLGNSSSQCCLWTSTTIRCGWLFCLRFDSQLHTCSIARSVTAMGTSEEAFVEWMHTACLRQEGIVGGGFLSRDVFDGKESQTVWVI